MSLTAVNANASGTHLPPALSHPHSVPYSRSPSSDPSPSSSSTPVPTLTANANSSLSKPWSNTNTNGSNRRKRLDTPDESTGTPPPTSSSNQQTRTRDGPKKKKANRACLHCQKAHLTCDDSRPCQRCVRRGMANSCTEGVRKKAKYLLDEEELEALKKGKSPAPSSNSNSNSNDRASSQPPSQPESQSQSQPSPSQTHTQTQPQQQAQTPTTTPSAMLTPPTDTDLYVPFDPNFPFGSEAANLEYSILSQILGSTSTPPDLSSTPPPSSTFASSSWPSPGEGFGIGGVGGGSGTSGAGGLGASGIGGSSTGGGGLFGGEVGVQPSELTAAGGGGGGQGFGYMTFEYPAPGTQAPLTLTGVGANSNQGEKEFGGGGFGGFGGQGQGQGQTQGPTLSLPNYVQTNLSPSNNSQSSSSFPSLNTLDPAPNSPTTESDSTPGVEVYRTVVRGYDYTEGYHFLMKHLPGRFEKNDILRVVRALAIIRPSLIALQMPLSEEDEAFVEKCLQRSLIELDKLISFSGTPTVVWRRTGEICLVGSEFCMLTEWGREELVGKRRYIYELFENQSVVEYWENFASHAFENTTQSVYSHCVLLKPSGAAVPCTFCFSIRRDIFDLPSLVIGQWLPLL